MRKMHLVGHLCTGPTNHHNGSWRHPESDVGGILDPARYENLARIYEKGLFDGVFFVDYQYVPDHDKNKNSLTLERGGQLNLLDPILLLMAMARVTKNLGLSATVSTAFHHPYYISRLFATLDHLSGGRAGWNVVTSASDREARSYGRDKLLDKNIRYDHADQVLEACMDLWNSWEPDALLIDKKSGRFADPAKVHYVDYNGSMVRAEGALTTPRSPQGHPVLMQAGSSPRGREFAARWAEVVFTHQEEKSRMQSFYADMKRRMAEKGRQPNACAILPSIDVIVAETEAKAHELAASVDALADIGMGMKVVEMGLGIDASQYSPDTPVADIEPKAIAVAGMYDNLIAIKKDGRGLTLKEAALLQATTWWSPRLLGTPEMVADQMQDLFESNCCDGFIIAQSRSPGGIEDFVRLVVPELQSRGIYRTEYAGRTFRENLVS